MHTTLMAYHHVLATNRVLAASGTKKKSGSSIVPFVVIIGVFLVAYVGYLRPRANRVRAQQAAAKRQLSIGDEVTTTAGMIATVVAVEDEEITLEIAPGVHVRYLPAAVLRVNSADEEEPQDAPDVLTHEVIDEPNEDSTDTPDTPAST